MNVLADFPSTFDSPSYQSTNQPTDIHSSSSLMRPLEGFRSWLPIKGICWLLSFEHCCLISWLVGWLVHWYRCCCVNGRVGIRKHQNFTLEQLVILPRRLATFLESSICVCVGNSLVVVCVVGVVVMVVHFCCCECLCG